MIKHMIILSQRCLGREGSEDLKHYSGPLNLSCLYVCDVVVCISVSIGMGFPSWLSGKESAYNEGDVCWVPRLGRSPGEGNGNPLQYPCLGNPMDRGAWWAAVHGVTKSQA